MKKLGLYYSLPLLATMAHAEQIGTRFELLNDVERIVFAADYSRIARAMIPESDSTEVATKVDSLFQEALGYQQESVAPLSWTFNVEGNKMGLVGIVEGADPAAADTVCVLGDSVSVNPKAIPSQRAQSSPLGISGAGIEAGYNGRNRIVGAGIELGDRVLVRATYGFPDSRDPDADGKAVYGRADPFFGTMSKTEIDTLREEIRNKSLQIGYIFPEFKNLELTVSGGYHWERKNTETQARSTNVDRNDSPLLDNYEEKITLRRTRKSTSPSATVSLAYRLGEKNYTGLSLTGMRNGDPEIGAVYRRKF